jgi:hypothetical protein
MQHHRQRKSKHQVLASKDDDNCVSDAWSRMGRSKTVNAQQNCTNANDVRAAYGSKAVHILDSSRETVQW